MVCRTFDVGVVVAIVSPELDVVEVEELLQPDETSTQILALDGGRLRTAPGTVILLSLENAHFTTKRRSLMAFGTDRLNPLVGLIPFNLLLLYILLVFLRRPHQNGHEFFGENRIHHLLFCHSLSSASRLNKDLRKVVDEEAPKTDFYLPLSEGEWEHYSQDGQLPEDLHPTPI
jgi:hypothetical protein